ncbi:MAG: response regulator [Candidatus Doudnabacteria bacterium]|nr:response regulator [Candidatus Doudnabacteria bacterium]
MSQNRNKILIVEDDDNLRKVLVDGLSGTGSELLEAGDGEQAVAVIVDQRPDLILLDLLLPKLDGFAVLERLRRYPEAKLAATRVVVLSNLWSNKDILRARALKVDEYFVKANTNIEDVFVKIKLILSQHP